MLLTHTDGRLLSELVEVRAATSIGTAPVEFSAQVSEEAASALVSERAPFYRASESSERFTVTIDRIVGTTISGTIRRR